jgi:peptidoglycan/LPS O-acetylase OafA/YrhL
MSKEAAFNHNLHRSLVTACSVLTMIHSRREIAFLNSISGLKMSVTAAPLALDRVHKTHRGWTLPRAVPELDGIRGLAILLVLICHATSFMEPGLWRSLLSYGKVGVYLFFVLSGFLITGILIDTKQDYHRTRNFYVRRGRRIWPLHFVYLAGAMLLFRRMLPPQPHLWAYLLFIQKLPLH